MGECLPAVSRAETNPDTSGLNCRTEQSVSGFRIDGIKVKERK